MVIGIKQKKLKFVLLTLLALMLCAIAFLGFPVFDASAQIDEDDYESFYQTFVEMVQEYDVDSQSDGIAVAKIDEEAKPNYQTRLIVTSDNKLQDETAVASCNYKNHYYFQYQDYYDTDKAYEYFSGLEGVEVMYDYKTTINADSIEINASNYYSWGWNAQNDYLGANSYLTTLMETVGSENLKGQVVAVLDTGINVSHNLFKNRILTKYARNYTNSNVNDYIDENGHGTHVSGTIAEITPASVKILPLRVLDANGDGYVSYITNAIDYAIRVKAQVEEETGFEFKIMNMSLGISQNAISNSNMVSANATISKTDLSGWVNAAYGAGLLSVVSAGNTETGGRRITSSPANVPNAITVSALKMSANLNPPLLYDASYSDYGETVDFAAPGTHITSAGLYGTSSTATLSGTSMAAPHVTACVALIYLHPDYNALSFEELNILLRSNADRSLIYKNGYALGANQVKNDYYGYGIINIKNIGMVIEGKVSFSVENPHLTSATIIKLNSDISCGPNQTVEIYYTTDETVDSVSSLSGIRYTSGGITVSKSTRILATAFVKQNGSVVKRSEVATKVYYVGNKDLDSRFKVSNGIITGYTGTELTTLVVPNVVKSETIYGLGSKVFNSSLVETLYLPDRLTSIGTSAFEANNKIKNVYCFSSSVSVGDNAFRYSKSIEVVEVPNIKSIGQLAFASSSIKNIELPKIKTIGKDAFSASSLETILIGKDITSIVFNRNVSLNNLKTVYGYSGTVAEDFIDYAPSSKFYDLSLRFLENLPKQKIFEENSTVSFRLAYTGLDVSIRVSGDVSSEKINISTSGDSIENVAIITVSNLRADTYNFKLDLTDTFGKTISSNVLKLVVVPRDTEKFTLTYNKGNYKLYIDDELINSDVELYKGQSYTIKCEALPGYDLNSVFINGMPGTVYEQYIYANLNNVDSDVSIKVNTVEKDRITVNFVCEQGSVYVNSELITESHYTVDRNATISFKIESNQGWVVKRVFVDGEDIEAVDGVYTISNITQRKKVEVKFEEANYLVEITFVNSCGSYIVSNGGNLINVAHGSSREITISAFEGYVIDFVSIDGKILDIIDGTFTINEIDSDKEVIVSFKAEKTSLFKRDDSAILYYFIIFLALFVIFIIGLVVMKIVRRKQKED